MWPKPFDYARPECLEEAVALLQRYGEEAVLLAGGQSLIPAMKLRLASPSHLIDLGRLAELAYIEPQPEGGVTIGAMTTHRAIAASSLIQSCYPVLAETARQIGDAHVRNRGTIGGSLCHADPAADYLPVMLITGASLRAVGPAGRREIPAGEFFQGIYSTSLQAGEILTEISFPSPPLRAAATYLKCCRRSGDFAIVGVAALIQLGQAGEAAPGGEAGQAASGDGVCQQAAIAVGGAGQPPLRIREGERLLRGRAPTPAVLNEAAQAIATLVSPSEDLYGSEAYKRELVRVLTGRALRQIVQRLQGRGGQ